MKTNRYIVGVIVALIIAFTLCAFGQTPLTNDVPDAPDVSTNAPAATLPPGIDQVAGLFGEKAKAVITQVALWVGSLSLIIAPFAVRLGNWLRDKLNAIAANQGGNTDEWLAKLFANPAYRFASTLLLFVNISLPTTAELERAIALQKEAVAAAEQNVKTGG